jgi:hypothetical protein
MPRPGVGERLMNRQRSMITTGNDKEGKKMDKKAWFILPVLFLVAGVASGEEALVTGFHLKPAAAIVKVGGTVKLKLVYCTVIDKSGNDSRVKSDKAPKAKVSEDDLAPLVDPAPEDDLAPLPVLTLDCDDELAPLKAPVDVKWEVSSGPGQISGDKAGATYQAPATMPTPNKATVSATLTYNVGKEKTILLSNITILDKVKTYSGKFSRHEVTVNSEYTSDLAGNIRWDFEEYYDIGGWREYKGKGKASFNIDRKGCGAAGFSNVPVEGWLKVHDDQSYEFQINLVSEDELVRTCRRGDAEWEESYTSAGETMVSGDPCGMSESYEHFTDITDLTFVRSGSCKDVVNQYQQGWSFKAVE